jgi:hypothetical protein
MDLIVYTLSSLSENHKSSRTVVFIENSGLSRNFELIQDKKNISEKSLNSSPQKTKLDFGVE